LQSPWRSSTLWWLLVQLHRWWYFWKGQKASASQG
jgi:hypothetical protein